jgi:hypothetical protein
MVSRFRIEAKARTEQEVNDSLVKAAKELVELFGGSWHTDDKNPPQVQTAASGYWGFLWMKRIMH